MNNIFAELTSLPVVAHEDGTFTLTRKFADGMNAYADAWDGPVVAVMNPATQVTDNLDNVRVAARDVAFKIAAIPFQSAALRAFAAKAAFVHWGPHYLLHDLNAVLRAHGVADVYSTEYSLKTRIQIVNADFKNPLRRLRKYLWEYGQERKAVANLAAASGFEANGTPTYNAYKRHNERNLLYFATWMREAEFIQPAALETRLQHMENPANALRLVFSGRLNAMKGAPDLIALAGALRRRQVNFSLAICGAGQLEGEMRRRIEKDNLQDWVQMKGVLPFSDGLVPFVREHCDLFVCCHKQGDPSSTYLETAACGVPIAGYGNEAFAGLLEIAGLGWQVRLGDAEALAERIAKLNGERHAIASMARSARAFAQDHAFEKTMARRMAFFKDVAKP